MKIILLLCLTTLLGIYMLCASRIAVENARLQRLDRLEHLIERLERPSITIQPKQEQNEHL